MTVSDFVFSKESFPGRGLYFSMGGFVSKWVEKGLHTMGGINFHGLGGWGEGGGGC